MTILDRVKKALNSVFGEVAVTFTAHTDMDEVEQWDSLSYFEVVAALESEFSIEFDEEEVTQLFHVGHIVEVIRSKMFSIPHGDVTHANMQLAKIISNDSESCTSKNLVLVSASSTREALLPMRECQELLDRRTQDINGKTAWYNLSVSGLVLAESAQIIEYIKNHASTPTQIILGVSPIILGGCGVSEFSRAARFERFPFDSTLLRKAFFGTNYEESLADENGLWSPQNWAVEYATQSESEGRDLIYDPYIYPSLAPWDSEKFRDGYSIERFYNLSFYNFEESFKLNEGLLKALVNELRNVGIEIVFCELTLHSLVKEYLQDFGEICSTYTRFITDFVDMESIRYVDPSALIGIRDENFRDPAHIFERKKEYTEALIDAVITH